MFHNNSLSLSIYIYIYISFTVVQYCLRVGQEFNMHDLHDFFQQHSAVL